MTTKGKFNTIKLSYTSNNVTITRSIPDELFNGIIETRMTIKDNSCTLYDALTYSVYKLAQIFTDNELQSLHFECTDDMGFKIKIER